jgi:probable lipoprotein NlpC
VNQSYIPLKIASAGRIFGYLVLVYGVSSCSLFKKSGSKPARLSQEIIATARGYLGTPYRSGGTTAKGMDCSGLLFTTFKTVGIDLPRISWQQAEAGQQVRISDVQPGDLVFFVTNRKGQGAINHSGIVTEIRQGQVLFIHASTSKGVREDNLYTDYWRSAFAKAIRVK